MQFISFSGLSRALFNYRAVTIGLVFLEGPQVKLCEELSATPANRMNKHRVIYNVHVELIDSSQLTNNDEDDDHDEDRTDGTGDDALLVHTTRARTEFW